MDMLRPGFASRRKEPRYPAALACIARWPGCESEGAVLDLSADGASITLPAVPPGARSPFTLSLFPDDANPLVLPCEPVAVEPDPLGGWLIRLHFGDLAVEPAADLAGVLRALRAEFIAGQTSIALDRLGPVRRARFPHYPPLLLR
jgi:hypothetical protein